MSAIDGLDVQKQALKCLRSDGETEIPEDMKCNELFPGADAGDKKKFFLKVRSRVIFKAIQGHFSNSTLIQLNNSSSKFRWLESNGEHFDDGPTMLKTLMDDCNPSVRVGVENIKKKIENARLNHFKGDVSECMSDIAANYRLILEADEKHENIVRDAFNALLSSGNSNFHTCFALEKMKWEQGTDFAFENLSKSSIDTRTNMKESGDWNKVDTKDAKIMALTTQVSNLEQNRSSTSKETSKQHRNGEIDPRRTKKKGDSIAIDGVTLWWCPCHKHPVKFPNGLHVNHKPEDHDEWKTDKEAKKKRREQKWKQKDPEGKSSAQPKQQLKLKETMKNVLMTNYAFSEEAADETCNSTKEKLPKDFQ